MAGSSGTFSVVISAQDNASKQIDALNRHIAALQAPSKRLNQSLGRLAENTGVAQLTKGLSSMARSTVEAADAMTRMVGPLGAITGVASIGGMAMLSAQWAQFGTKLAFAAQRSWTTVSQLGALQGAARLAGSSAEALTSGITALNDNLTNAAAGRAPEAVQAFGYIGVSVRDVTGRLKTVSQVLPEVADKIAAIRNPTIQAQVATMLFGGAAEDLLPFLRRGSAGIAEYTAMARRYGIMNERGSQAAQQLREQQVQLSLSVQGLGFAIAEKLQPVVGPMLTRLADWIANNRDLIAQDIAGWVGNAVPKIEELAGKANNVAQAFGGWERVLEGIVAIKFVSWAAAAAAPIIRLLKLLALVPGSGVTAAMIAPLALSGDTPEGGQEKPPGAGPYDWYYRNHDPRAADPNTGAPPMVDRRIPGRAGSAPAPRAPLNATPLNPWAPAYVPPAVRADRAVNGQQPSSPSDPRGIRNNNPLNLSYVPGQGASGSDGRFGVYPTMQQGVAADTRQLLRYQDVYGLNTVRGIINRWAPPGENNTSAYVTAVAARMGVTPDTPLNLHDQATAAALVAAMAHQETGRDLDKRVIAQGVASALGVPAPAAARQPPVGGASAPPQSLVGGGPPLPKLRSPAEIVSGAPALAPSANINGGTGMGPPQPQETTVRGSADVRISLSGAPPGTRASATSSGDLFAQSGAPRVDLGQVGNGLVP